MAYQDGKWAIIHDRYLDDYGFEKDHFDLFDTEARIHYPFIGYMKVSNKGRDFPINKVPYDYTNEDYIKMMEVQVAKVEKRGYQPQDLTSKDNNNY